MPLPVLRAFCIPCAAHLAIANNLKRWDGAVAKVDTCGQDPCVQHAGRPPLHMTSQTPASLCTDVGHWLHFWRPPVQVSSKRMPLPVLRAFWIPCAAHDLAIASNLKRWDGAVAC